MNSWKLFRQTPHLWHVVDDSHPVFIRETLHPPAWRIASVRVPRYAFFVAVLGVVALIGGMMVLPFTVLPVLLLMSLCVVLPVLMIAPSLGIWAFLLGMAIGPVIARERVERTWDLLRVSPLAADTLVLHKLRGALWWLRGPMRFMQMTLLVGALGVALMAAGEPLSYTNASSAAPMGTSDALAGAGLALVAAVLFLFDRGQQLVLMTMAALNASATAASQQAARGLAISGALIVWAVDLLAAGLALTLLPVDGYQRSAGLVLLLWLGPVGSYAGSLSPSLMLLAAVGTLLIREAAVRGLWRFALNAAANR